MTPDHIAAIKALDADKIEQCRMILVALTVDASVLSEDYPAEITLKQPEWTNRVNALCDMAAALEASEAARLKAEQERDAAQKSLRRVQNAAKTLAHSRDSELQRLLENGAYDHKLRAEHDSLIERDAMMTILNRLREASTGSSELDGDIALALGQVSAEAANWTRREDGWLWYRFVEPDDFDTWEAPRYTTSIDAALALVERMLPEHDWIIGHTNSGLTIHAQLGPNETYFGNSPALAILVALLTAIEAKENPK